MMPEFINGYAKQVPTFNNVPDLIQKTIDFGFGIADRQVSTLAREPVYNAYYFSYRSKMQQAEKNFKANKIKELVKQGKSVTDANKIATDLTARRYSALANDMAMNRMIGFVDNPLVRTNLAFSARNIARYYRATEDFYRRVYRAAKFDPESIVRLRLTSEGLDHAGFIHEDEEGERYFFMPIDQIMYATLNPIVETLTGEPMKQPMPLRLTGKIKMLTPSLDPESALPALSGPFAAVSITLLRNLIPDEFLGAKDTFNRYTLGPYAENQSLFDMVTPTLIKRSYEILNATLGDDELSSQAASAALKSAAFYAANGMAPGADAEVAERDEFRRNVQSTARNIVVLRNLLGIFSPVAPQIMTSGDVPKSLLETGVVNFKSEFNNLVQVELEKGNANAYDEALRKWTKLNPGRLVYTVSETEMNKVASVAKTKQAAEWVKRNGSLLDKHPEGAGFLIPAAGEFDIESYSFLKREGFIESKPLEKFLGEVATIDDENQYYDMRDEMESKLANVGSASDKSYLRQKFDAERKAFLDARPYLRLQLEQVGGDQVKRDALTDLRNLVNAEYAPQNATTAKIREMITIFDRATSILSTVVGRTDEEIAQREYIRNKAYNDLVKLAETNPNASMVLNKIMKRLLGV
jgi:hypothetical protein